jgi:hypothetical protein
MSTKGKTSIYDVLSESEDELDWEEVTVPQAQHIELEELEDQAGPSTGPNIEVTLEAYPTHRKGDKQYAGFFYLTDGRFEVALQEEVFWRHPAR